MKFVSFYFFIALFIGFFLIYVFKNDYKIILKNKGNKICAGETCDINEEK